MKSSSRMESFRLKNLKKMSERGLQRGRLATAVFGPGLFFVILGLITLFAPGLLLAVVASLFIFLGVIFCIVAFKFVQLKRRVEETMQQFPGRVFVQGVTLHNPGEFELSEEEEDEDDVFIIH